MEFIFFGDSLTAGENCERCDSFCYNITTCKMMIKNLAVSGTTIGEYSIYPVDGYSLLGRISVCQNEIRKADKIFIEYGSNDVSAVMCGFATVQTVVVSFVKALDWIRQINPRAEIYFLTFGDDDVIKNRGERMCYYLKNDYFKEFNFDFPVSKYCDIYKQIVDNISKVCDTITMFDSEMVDDKYISDDGIHPNVEGHKRIANNIIKQL